MLVILESLTVSSPNSSSFNNYDSYNNNNETDILMNLNDTMGLSLNETTTTNNSSSGSDGGGPSSMLPYRDLDLTFQIGLYSTIFLLAVVGNVLVILTLVQNQGMRTITNLFLLNLAISDLLVGVFCMPFTLVGIILRDFVFGAILCKLIPYVQAVAVSVSAWTLVAISVERYYAICHPLTSRRWQTLSHAYKIIAVVWILSLLCMSPIAILSVLQPIRNTGRHKCREEWPDRTLERTYTVFLDIILLVLPLVIMTVKYSLITRTLWQEAGGVHEQSYTLTVSGGDKTCTPSASPSKPLVTVTTSESNDNHHHHHQNRNSFRHVSNTFNTFRASFRRNNSMRPTTPHDSINIRTNLNQQQQQQQQQTQGLLQLPNTEIITENDIQVQQSSYVPPPPTTTKNRTTGKPTAALLRRCNVAKSLRRKKRVIQMLGAVVTEFFVCWTPLYIMNTWYLFSPHELYEMIGPLGVSLVQLLAYISSCSNPITYCFMNRGFRIAFFHVFGCHCGLRRQTSTSHRSESLRLARNRSLYNTNYKTSNHV